MATTAGVRVNYVPKIPRDFVPRTLRRLLPEITEIEKLSKDQLVKLATQQNDLTKLIKTDPSRFFIPNPGGQRAFATWWDYDEVKKVLLFLAGNKTGKTTIGALLMGERLLGKALWARQERSQLSHRTPAVGICFTEDFESHRDTILPTILSWWPHGDIKTITMGTANTPSEIHLKNGSVLKFKTYAQGADTAEGKDWDLVWFDEPPPHTVYTAGFRGIVSTGGRMYITATLLKEAWIADEVDQPYAQGFQAEIHDNEWIKTDAKEAFLASLSDEEREVRESGKPFSLTGVIYKYFRDADPYVVEPFKLNERWPYFIGVDPHERRPVHVGFFTITPQNEIVFLDYCLVRGSVMEIMEQIRQKENQIGIPYPTRFAIMDPNRGSARQIDKLSWQDVFEENGWGVTLGQDEVNIGHSKMWDYLKIQTAESRFFGGKRPRLLFTTACRGKYGPIWQMQRYAWDDWQKSLRSQRDVKEVPKQYNKDFPDICRYVAMEDLDFDILLNGPKIIQAINPNFRPYGKVA